MSPPMSAPAAMLADVSPWNLLALDKALRASWAADTCSPDDLARAGWQSDNPASGHCDITAVLVNDIFGGDLVLGEVHLEGEQQGFHWWNRLPTGVDLDLTREQFQLGQRVSELRVVERPSGRLPRRNDEYLLLRERVGQHLSTLPENPRRARATGSGGGPGVHRTVRRVHPAKTCRPRTPGHNRVNQRRCSRTTHRLHGCRAAANQVR